MKRYATRQMGTWSSFGTLMLISLGAWAMGSPGLALVLAIGAMGALFLALSDRLSVRRTIHRTWHHG